MPGLYHRIFDYTFIAFAGMDTRVTDFILQRTARLMKAWKGRLPTNSSGDIETGFLHSIQPPPINHQKYPTQLIPRENQRQDGSPRGLHHALSGKPSDTSETHRAKLATAIYCRPSSIRHCK